MNIRPTPNRNFRMSYSSPGHSNCDPDHTARNSQVLELEWKGEYQSVRFSLSRQGQRWLYGFFALIASLLVGIWPTRADAPLKHIMIAPPSLHSSVEDVLSGKLRGSMSLPGAPHRQDLQPHRSPNSALRSANVHDRSVPRHAPVSVTCSF